MKHLSKEEVKELTFYVKGRLALLHGTKLLREASKLNIGEGLEFTLEDWPLKAMPVGNFFNRIALFRAKGIRFSLKRMQKGKKYILARIK